MKASLVLSLLLICCFLSAISPQPLTIPEITINGGLVQDFGSQYLGYASSPRAINIQNTGSVNLIIQSIEVPNTESPFVLINPPMPMSIAAGSSSDFWMIFHPSRLGSLSDSLFISSNDPLTPNLRVRLRGSGIYVPPAAVQNLSINMVGDDAVVNWDPVSTTIFGLPLVPDRYIVLFSEAGGTQHFWQLANTNGLSYTHLGVAEYCPTMFYQVKAVVFYRDEDRRLMDEISRSRTLLSDADVEALFRTFLTP